MAFFSRLIANGIVSGKLFDFKWSSNNVKIRGHLREGLSQMEWFGSFYSSPKFEDVKIETTMQKLEEEFIFQSDSEFANVTVKG